MTMKKISNEDLLKLQKKYGFKYVKVKGTQVVNIAKTKSDRMDIIDFEEFTVFLKKRKLAVYKSEKGDFLKIMSDK